MSKLSFVIPCYGSEHTIEAVIGEIINVVSTRPIWDYEIICVNDCSPDDVLAVLKRLVADNSRLMAVDLAKNMGKHSAVMAGYSFVTGDVIINLDDDGQCPLLELWNLIEPLENGYDISSAIYFEKKESGLKKIGSKVNHMMSHILIGKPYDLKIENFSAIKRYVVDEIVRYRNPYPYIEGLFLRTTAKIANVQMDQRERYAGNGNFTFTKSISLWLNGFTAFSVKPLRVASIVGVFCALIGFIWGVVIIFRKLVHPEMPMGYASTVTLLLFIGGAIMGMLGMLGEYVGRIYISINNAPQYVVKEVIRPK
jgi:undecaprenyl-phosphate 4-deoxy-4-formamido-L-arabinose transferase